MKLCKILLVFLCVFSDCWAASSIVCPSSITCSYIDGTCENIAKSSVDGTTSRPFQGSNTFQLTRITGQKIHTAYFLNCEYKHEKSGTITVTSMVQELEGESWKYSGFGNYMAICSDLSCTGYGELIQVW